MEYIKLFTLPFNKQALKQLAKENNVPKPNLKPS